MMRLQQNLQYKNEFLHPRQVHLAMSQAVCNSQSVAYCLYNAQKTS